MENLIFFRTYCRPDTEEGDFTYTIELNPSNNELLGNGKKGSEK